MAGTRRRVSSKGKEDDPECVQIDQKSSVLRKRKSSISQGEPSNKIKKTTPARKASKSKEVVKEKSIANNNSLKKNCKIKDEVKTRDGGMENEQSLQEQFLSTTDTWEGKDKEQYLKARLDKCKKQNEKLVKDNDAAVKKEQTLLKSRDSLRDDMKNFRSSQSVNLKDEKKKEEAHKKNVGKKVEEKEKEKSMKEQRRNRDVKARKMEAYNKMRTTNNTALLHEASRLKDDNIRLKRIISTVIMNSRYGMATGRL